MVKSSEDVTRAAGTFTVSERQANQRLDKIVAEWLPDLSRRELRELFECGAVLCRGKALAKGQLGSAGQEIEIVEAPPSVALPGAPPIRVVRESDAWVLVDKPAGLPSAPKHRPDAVSAASQLGTLYPAMAGIGYGPHDAGLLSRLDTGTSGLLLAAKTKEAFDAFRAGARAQALHKVYVGLIAKGAALTEGSIDLPLGPHRSNRRKVAWGRQITGRALPARTLVRKVQPLERCTLVVLEVNTAYRHQLRAHLAFTGCPLLGDTLYGGSPFAGLSRHALHSYELRWDGADSLARFEERAPLPSDLSAIAGLSSL